ncbi:MAG: uracil-DNA glycosylase [Micavibrio aeruginosavorus]|uniref:Type-4 uracil-DNA glycosylase n=1 Tax=Micavibrio aeruginosavorus TaxID=349221 RepID=A0A7T5UG71_9BACT|nr:MAG: uracil-DNA glycosylase [Micavibrio aeruginosavorus]
MSTGETAAYLAALQWHLDQGIDEALADTPGQMLTATAQNMFDTKDMGLSSGPAIAPPEKNLTPKTNAALAALNETPPIAHNSLPATPALREEAVKLAQKANSLQDLETALRGFEGLTVRKTATNMVFAAGNPHAALMVIGDCPGSDDDRQGTPFSGAAGLLMDRILQSIGMTRNDANPAQAAYLTQILNWRPPGNRTPSEAEMDISLPLIERHIALAQPRLLLLCGGLTAQTLLGQNENISRLRGRWHNYAPRTEGLAGDSIPALVTYHPLYLLATPGQKRAVWADMLMLAEKRRELGIPAQAA